MNQEGLLLDLADNEWPISTIDHDRLIARAIVVDNEDNFYFLCKVISFGDKHLTKDEIEDFHLSTLKLKYEEALGEYEKCRCTGLGRLVANREIPVLKRAKELLYR